MLFWREKEEDEEPNTFSYAWEILDYDCAPPEFRSPIFHVSFEVTEWYMEVNFLKLQNIDSCIGVRLQREPGIGPCEVTLDVNITVTASDNEDFKHESFFNAKTFSEKENFLYFHINIPSQKRQSEDQNWQSSEKKLLINLKMKKPIPEFSKKYWKSKTSMKTVIDALKTLRPTKEDPPYYDLILKVPGKEFKLHKSILHAGWPKLLSVLEISTPPDEVETKEFSDISHALLEHLLNYIYYGDINFMHHFQDYNVFDVVKKFNFYHLDNQISQLSSRCEVLQSVQNYTTSFYMKLKNVTSKTNVGDSQAFPIPLRPTKLSETFKPMDPHIEFMLISLFVEKGPLGYNWLKFSIVLSKLPEKNPVFIKCKLYVVDESNVNHLLTEEHFVFARENFEILSSEFPFSEGKEIEQFCRISEPVITWEELTDERKCFMKKRLVNKSPRTMLWPGTPYGISLPRTTAVSKLLDGNKELKLRAQAIEEKDIYFRFQVKLTDGEYVCQTIHGPVVFKYDDQYTIYQHVALALMREDKFTDIEVTSGNRSVKAHKAILAARSPRIKKTIQEAEKKLNSLPINIQPDYLDVFIHYLYTGQIQEVPFDKIDHLIAVAEEYEMECLKDLLKVEKDRGAL